MEELMDESMVMIKETELTTEVRDILIRCSEEWEAEESCHGYRRNTEEDLKGRRIFLAQHGKETVGYLFGRFETTRNAGSIAPEGTPFFEVEELYVSPGFRNEGIGKELFRKAEEAVRENAELLMLSTASRNWRAVLHFYIDELEMEFWSARLYKKLRKH